MPILRTYNRTYPHPGNDLAKILEEVPLAALPGAWRGWYSACRGIKRQARLNLFQAQFGRCIFRFGYLGFPSGLSRPGEARPIQALCEYLDHPEPATLGRTYRRLRINELRARRLRQKEA